MCPGTRFPVLDGPLEVHQVRSGTSFRPCVQAAQADGESVLGQRQQCAI